ncbi:MAG: hypothetical protein LBM04_05815 [Opitutaceae bacterium]|nr:hypothetical protein [Opitutaceae bacterium]
MAFVCAVFVRAYAYGRISISGQVGRGEGIDGVREEKMPSVIAQEAIQSQERFVTGLGPKLAGSFEATLILAAGRLDGAAAHGFIALTRTTIMKTADVVFEVADGALQVRLGVSIQALERLAQPVEQARGLVGFELPEQGAYPLCRRGCARPVQRLGDCQQMLFGVIEVEALPGFGEAVIDQIPYPHRSVGHHQHNTLNRFAALSSEAIVPGGGSRDGDEPFAQTGALPSFFGEFILAESPTSVIN